MDSQSLLDAYSAKVSWNNPYQHKRFVDSLQSTALQSKSFQDLVQIGSNYAYKLYYKGYPKLGIEYQDKVLQYYSDYLGTTNEDFSVELYRHGVYHLDQDNIIQAEKSFRQIIDLNNNITKVGQAYCSIGACFKKTGDLYKAVDYYKKGLPFLETRKEYFTEQALKLAILYETINNASSLEDKRALLEKTERINPPDSMLKSFASHYFSYNDAFANYYDNPETFNFLKAKEYHRNNLNAAERLDRTDLFYHIYTNLGTLYSSVKNDSAIYYLNKAVALSEDSNKISRNRHFLAEHYLQNGNNLAALNASNFSLKNSLSADSLDINKLPSAKLLFEFTTDKDVTLWSMISKATALIGLYEEQGETKNIREALDLLTTADNFIDIINNKELELNSKFYWREEAADIYSKIVLCANALNKPEEAIAALEKSKALLLTEAILNNQAKKNIPEKIILKENLLKQKIGSLDFQLEASDNDSLQRLLFSSKQGYEQFLDSVRVEYPWYKSVNEVSEIFTLANIQKTLTENQVILWYSLSTNTDYINKASAVLLTKNGIEIEIIQNQKALLELIGQYKAFVSRPLATKEELNSYRKISFELYKALVPEAYRSQIKNKQVTIIPEGDLQNIPFESLITVQDSDNYLLYNMQISYAYSMSSLLHAKDIDREASKSLVGYAPINFEAIGLPDLTYSEKELQNINEHIDIELYTNQNANYTSFLNDSKDYNIIHLATHADATNNPWIGFSDKKVMLHELYTLENNAELVVLSACNTSQGAYAKGEGVLSLARGFFHSGANSVIASLWTVNDKQTAKLTSNFYKNVAEGQTKISALHNAKINYLKTHELTDASPYYWASLVLIGDTDPVNFDTNNSLYYASIAILTVLAALFILKRRKKKYL